MKHEEIRKTAIERHDLDAPFFQNEYEKAKDKYSDEFIYGRYQVNDELEEMVKNLPAGSRVLDIGSGTGHLANFLTNKGFTVVGLEPSKNMLQFARQNFPQIQFVEGVSNELPFPDASFDLVISIEVMRYLHPADIAKTYSEVNRVLKKDGYFFVSHVNRFSSDLYVFFYYLKGIGQKAKGKAYQNCYFTTASKEVRNLQKAGFSRAWGVGRMFGSVRIGYKFGKAIGKSWAKLLEKFSVKQKFTGAPLRDIAGHLFMIGQK